MAKKKGPKATAIDSSAPNQSLWTYCSTMTSASVEVIIEKHGLVREHVRVPTREEKGHCPPEGFDAWSGVHCDAGAIPPLSTYYADFVNFIGVTPFQLSPNTYYLLAALRVLFETEFGREPSHKEIMFLYDLRNRNNHSAPAFYFLRACPGFKPIEELRSNAGDYQRKYFFIQEDDRFPHRFQVARKIERPKEDEELKAMVKRLRELSKDERCATYLVTDELLRGCNLIGYHQSVGVKRKMVGKKNTASKKAVVESSESEGSESSDYSSSEASMDEIMGVVQKVDLFLDEELDLLQDDDIDDDEAIQSPYGESNMNTFKSIRRNTRQLEQEKRKEYEADITRLAEADRKKDVDLLLDDLFQDDDIVGDKANQSPYGESNMNTFKSIRRNTRQLEQEKRKEYEADKTRLAEADRKKDEEARRKVDRDRGSKSKFDASKDALKRDQSCDSSSDQRSPKRQREGNQFLKPPTKGAQAIAKPSTPKENVSNSFSPQPSPIQRATQQPLIQKATQQSPIPKAAKAHSSSSHKSISSTSDQALEISQLELPLVASEVKIGVDKLCQEYTKAKKEAEIYKASEAVLKGELCLFRTTYEANKAELEDRVKDIEKLNQENIQFQQSIFDICTQSAKIEEENRILKGEKAKWVEEKANLMEERAIWVKKEDKLTEEKNKIVEEKDKLEEENNTLRGENAGFKKEIAEMVDEFDNMMYYFWDANENGNFDFLREDKERIINECKRRRAREQAAEKMSPNTTSTTAPQITLKTEVIP